jgi:hypothetical protein
MAYEHKYSKSAVDAAIKRDKRIKGKEARMIHALLKGRQKSDEPDGDYGPYSVQDARSGFDPGYDGPEQMIVGDRLVLNGEEVPGLRIKWVPGKQED